jgi:hypothetical protein
LDDAQDPGSAGADPSKADRQPAGFRAQLNAVIAAVRRLVSAHVDLAKAEAGEIGAEIGRVAILVGIAFGAIFALLLLLPIGLLLFLGDLIFGSIGWGVLLGSIVLVDVALLAALVALGVKGSQIWRSLLIGLVVGIVLVGLGIAVHLQIRPWAAISVFIALVVWPIVAGYGVSREGIDMDALKARFYPTQTIETTKETIEWVRARTPLGRKS